MGAAKTRHAVLAGDDPVFGMQLIGDEAVAEGRVIGVDLTSGIDQVRVGPVPIGDRVGSPLVEALGGEPEHPAGHLDGDPVEGKVTDQRVDHFGFTPCPR